jgi:heme-NO-binding protein
MKGIVFNLLEDVVTRVHGVDTWDALIDASGVSGSYTSLGSYPDEEMVKLVMAASKALSTPPADVLRWFGREAMPLLAERYAGFFTPYTSARPFITSVNRIIHPEVRKVYPGADVPVFGFSDEPDGSLLMSYQSARRLCALAEGFIEGAAMHYGESAKFEHASCMHKGDDKCLIRIALSKVPRCELVAACA